MPLLTYPLGHGYRCFSKSRTSPHLRRLLPVCCPAESSPEWSPPSRNLERWIVMARRGPIRWPCRGQSSPPASDPGASVQCCCLGSCRHGSSGRAPPCCGGGPRLLSPDPQRGRRPGLAGRAGSARLACPCTGGSRIGRRSGRGQHAGLPRCAGNYRSSRFRETAPRPSGPTTYRGMPVRVAGTSGPL
jgi:hypothetical protein